MGLPILKVTLWPHGEWMGGVLVEKKLKKNLKSSNPSIFRLRALKNNFKKGGSK
jgi:hypothetical protein